MQTRKIQHRVRAEAEQSFASISFAECDRAKEFGWSCRVEDDTLVRERKTG